MWKQKQKNNTLINKLSTSLSAWQRSIPVKHAKMIKFTSQSAKKVRCHMYLQPYNLMVSESHQLPEYENNDSLFIIPWVAAQAVRWSGFPKVARSPLAQCSKSCDLQPARIAVCNTWSSGGTALCRVGGATSQLNLPSLTPLSVADCGWLQLMAPPLATSVNYCK